MFLNITFDALSFNKLATSNYPLTIPITQTHINTHIHMAYLFPGHTFTLSFSYSCINYKILNDFAKSSIKQPML